MKQNSFVTVSFIGDEEMKKLNKQFRGKDYPTDVLSFGINDDVPDGTYHLGDIVVNIEQARRQSQESGDTLEQEISELVAHGMLHLQGVHHEGDDH